MAENDETWNKAPYAVGKQKDGRVAFVFIVVAADVFLPHDCPFLACQVAVLSAWPTQAPTPTNPRLVQIRARGK